jgi:hypothetical protein
MHLEIRDLQSSKTIRVEVGGRILGREGASNDIGIPDRTVSSQHAKIFERDGRWFIEDLKSSNGTFVKGVRITSPAPIDEGSRFALCRYGFEVLRVVEESGVTNGDVDSATLEGKSRATQAARARPMGEGGTTGPRADRTAPRDASAPERAPSERSSPSDRSGRSSSGARRAGQNISTSAPLSKADPDEPLIPYVLKTQPAAWSFYLAAVPRILFNPVGVVRAAINDQQFPAMGTKDIAAYALPPLLLGVIVGTLGGIILSIVNKVFSVSVLISPLIGTALSFVIALVSGFIFHPLMRWIVELLRGESDEKSRSNYFICLFTAIPLTGLAGGIGILFTLLPVPFVSAVTPVLSVATTLIIMFVAYSWFRYFDVVKIATLIILVLGALACVGAVTSVIGIVRADIARLGSDTGSPDALAATDPAAAAAAAAALAAAAAGTPPPTGAPPPTAGSPGVMPPTVAAASPTPPAAAAEPAGASPVTGSAAAAENSGGETTPSGTSDFQEWTKRYDAIEAAIERDPTLLKKKGVLPLYKDLQKRAISAKQKYKSKPAKKPSAEQQAEAKINEKLREAETYSATAEVVDKLYGKIFDK